MIVCVCNNIPESEIRQAVQAGLITMRSLREELGVASCCGKCHGCAKELLQECLVREVSPERTIRVHAMVN
jgi:bacterioferritin-associated ferredoxin